MTCCLLWPRCAACTLGPQGLCTSLELQQSVLAVARLGKICMATFELGTCTPAHTSPYQPIQAHTSPYKPIQGSRASSPSKQQSQRVFCQSC
ncbi:hypothetical protein BD289DRAFT_127345 [Coniella lustricola]|uniref:Uncharacterized protein n=1 Tax=Coniella lustricola TaxID=2025994 RepID=A0A2T2ZWD1_9PEZI|nr:hypothetical protein BD289DRAFT_127345 [Coniella lustricola]